MWLTLHKVKLMVRAVLPTVCRLQLTSCPRPILDFSKGKNKCSKGSDEHFKGGSEPKVIMIIFYHFPKSSILELICQENISYVVIRNNI